MKFAKLLVLLIALTLFSALNVNAQSSYVTLKGKLKGFNNQVQIEDMSELQYLLPPTAARMIVPDTAGNFSIKFKIASANYYRLGRNQLYLSPNDDITVYIDYSDPNKATFNGVGAEANTYLKNTPFPKGGSFIAAGKNIKGTPEETIATVEEMALTREMDLATVTKITPEFRRLENARIKADLINSIISGNTYSLMKLKLKDDAAKAFSESYKKIAAANIAKYSIGFTDPSFMKLVVYRDVAEEVIANGGKPADIEKIIEFYALSTLVKEMQKLSNKQVLLPFKTTIDKFKPSIYKTATLQMHQYLMAFGKGDTAVDFVAMDQNGKKVNLSSLKGKVIYLDLWATWCGPCMEEMPSYDKLKAKYAANPNVVFVSLSIDDNEELWKGSLKQRNANGFQWLINRAKLQAYNIVGIPRSLLIDQNFKMVNMAAPLPSTTAVIKEIELLLAN